MTETTQENHQTVTQKSEKQKPFTLLCQWRAFVVGYLELVQCVLTYKVLTQMIRWLCPLCRAIVTALGINTSCVCCLSKPFSYPELTPARQSYSKVKGFMSGGRQAGPGRQAGSSEPQSSGRDWSLYLRLHEWESSLLFWLKIQWTRERWKHSRMISILWTSCILLYIYCVWRGMTEVQLISVKFQSSKCPSKSIFDKHNRRTNIMLMSNQIKSNPNLLIVCILCFCLLSETTLHIEV